MRESFDLFSWYGWQHMLRSWEWGYAWDDTFAWRICRLVARENVFETNRQLRFELDNARAELQACEFMRELVGLGTPPYWHICEAVKAALAVEQSQLCPTHNAPLRYCDKCSQGLVEAGVQIGGGTAAPEKAAAYRPDPYALYRCPYCNEDLRLINVGSVVDKHMNVCHIVCLDKLPKEKP